MLHNIYYSLSIFVLVCAISRGEGCHAPYVLLDNQCIYVHHQTQLDFQSARQYCQELGREDGGDLVSTPTCDQFVMLARYLELNGIPESEYWVGAQKGFSTNEWFWMTLESLWTGPPFFASDEGLAKNEHCAAMSGKKYWKLKDDNCDDEKYFICSSPITSQQEIVSSRQHSTGNKTLVTVNCPEDTIQIGEFCYAFVGHYRTWNYAENYCRDHYIENTGMLFYPDSCEEFTRVAHHLEVEEFGNYWWVGARDTTGDNSWFWVDGTSVSGGVPYWAVGQPSHSGLAPPNTQCAHMTDSKRFYLKDGSCILENRFICKLHANTI